MVNGILVVGVALQARADRLLETPAGVEGVAYCAERGPQVAGWHVAREVVEVVEKSGSPRGDFLGGRQGKPSLHPCLQVLMDIHRPVWLECSE